MTWRRHCSKEVLYLSEARSLACVLAYCCQSKGPKTANSSDQLASIATASKEISKNWLKVS